MGRELGQNKLEAQSSHRGEIQPPQEAPEDLSNPGSTPPVSQHGSPPPNFIGWASTGLETQNGQASCKLMSAVTWRGGTVEGPGVTGFVFWFQLSRGCLALGYVRCQIDSSAL